MVLTPLTVFEQKFFSILHHRNEMDLNRIGKFNQIENQLFGEAVVWAFVQPTFVQRAFVQVRF